MKDTKALVVGALTTAIFIALFLICVYIPLIGIVGMLFCPIPLMFYTAKWGAKPGIIAFLASFILSLLFTHPLTAVSALLVLSVGYVMGCMLFLRKSAFAVLGAGSLAAIACLVLSYGMLVTLLHINPVEEIVKSADKFSKMAEQMGTQASKEQWENYRNVIKMLPTLIPYAVTVGGILYSFITELISAPILRRFGLEFPKFPPFREWTLPRSLIWYYLLALALLYFGGLDQNGTLFMVTLNVFEMLEMAMVLQGIILIFFFCHSRGMKLAVPVIISIIGVIIPFTLYIIRILGIIDLGIGLRARIRKQ